MDTHIYLLVKTGIADAEYLTFNLEEALIKGQELSLSVYRIRVRASGTTTVMKIFTPTP
jgi:hypothetical protein